MNQHPTRPAAILFDLDGTLLDSLASIGVAMNEALASLGLPTHPIDAYRRFVGDGVRVLAERVLAPEQHHHIAALLAAYRPLYRARQLDAPAYDGIFEMLSALEAAGIPMCVLTNKPDDLALEIVGALFRETRFVVVRGEREGVPKKPDPTQALELAAAVGVEPASCWFVGDTPTDIATAKNAGMRPIAVLWGFRGRDELERAGAETLVDAPAALVRLALSASSSRGSDPGA
ncbi:MAG: HAD family hydrolase [Myxococcales bacterium]|nr:HAD family hydrolase [Myxococcales bacterium]